MADKADYETGIMLADKCVAGKIRKIDRFVIGIYDRALKGKGIRITQAVILVFLMRGGRSCTGIGRALIMDKSTVSRNLERMKKNGWISISEDQLVEITSEGVDLIMSALDSWEKAQTATEELLGEDGLAAVDLLLEKIDKIKQRL